MSFNIALSGLNVALSDLSVTGNNIANSSTHGFKESRAEFADVYAVGYQGISGNAIGNGVRLANVAQQHTQGNLQFTSNNLDLAVKGQGFFILNDGGDTAYTRAGAFGVDQSGYVVNSSNQRLQVFPYDQVAGSFNTAQLSDLQLESGLGQPSATNDVDVGINLLAAPSSVFDPDPASPQYEAFDRTDPTTYHYSTSVTTYDSLGEAHISTMYYRKLDDTTTFGGGGAVPTNTWETYLYTQDSNGRWIPVDGEAANAATGTHADLGPLYDSPPAEAVPGTPDLLTFDSSGQLAQINLTALGPGRTSQIIYGSDTAPNTAYPGAPDVPAVYNTPGFNPANGAEAMGGVAPTDPTPDQERRLVFDYGNSTQFNADYSVQQMDQDGYSAGRLAGMDVDETGTVYARYSNGQARTLGRVALANFANPQGLRQLGDTNWSESFTSGQALNGEAGTGNFGNIQSGALESSNVEITEQLVKMITAQRNFQANSQMLSTEDQVTQTMLNIR